MDTTIDGDFVAIIHFGAGHKIRTVNAEEANHELIEKLADNFADSLHETKRMIFSLRLLAIVRLGGGFCVFGVIELLGIGAKVAC